MKYIFPLLLVCILSCKKDHNNIEVTGIALHSITKAPVPNQEIILNMTYYKLAYDNPMEFPDGYTVYDYTQYKSSTDQNGIFRFTIQPRDQWTYTIDMNTNQYIIQKLQSLNPQPQYAYGMPTLNEMYDTIYAETPGYIRYHIKNTGTSFNDDTLLVSTPYAKKFIDNRPTSVLINVVGIGHNWTFIGSNIDEVITDTIPSESFHELPISWEYLHSGAVNLIHDTVNIPTNGAIDYFINY